jgi:hypothetical protein
MNMTGLTRMSCLRPTFEVCFLKQLGIRMERFEQPWEWQLQPSQTQIGQKNGLILCSFFSSLSVIKMTRIKVSASLAENRLQYRYARYKLIRLTVYMFIWSTAFLTNASE